MCRGRRPKDDVPCTCTTCSPTRTAATRSRSRSTQHEANVAGGARRRRPAEVITGAHAARRGRSVTRSAHSLSPALHNAALRRSSASTGSTSRSRSHRASAARALDAMRTLGLGGLSVTMPHKEDVAAAVDVLDPAAAALRSVNTVVPLGRRSARGLQHRRRRLRRLAARAGVRSRRAHASCVLGAGAAARAVVDALAASRRRAVSRRQPQRRPRADAAAAAAPARSARVGVAADVCATPTSWSTPRRSAWATDELPFDPALLRAGAGGRRPRVPPARHARCCVRRAASVRDTVDGLGMLVHQAALQQQLWLGVRARPAVMRAAAAEELRAHARQ